MQHIVHTKVFVCAIIVDSFYIYILFNSKYSCIKLGKPNDTPEYNDFTWFMMLFACGVGVGLFFYGVAEPIFHYTGENRYTANAMTADNELAQTAIFVSIYHWSKYICAELCKTDLNMLINIAVF